MDVLDLKGDHNINDANRMTFRVLDNTAEQDEYSRSFATIRPDAGQAPGQRPRIAVKLIPGHGEGLLDARHGGTPDSGKFLLDAGTGRDKAEGAPLTGTKEFDTPDFTARDAEGEFIINPLAHIALVAPENNGGAPVTSSKSRQPTE